MTLDIDWRGPGAGCLRKASKLAPLVKGLHCGRPDMVEGHVVLPRELVDDLLVILERDLDRARKRFIYEFNFGRRV